MSEAGEPEAGEPDTDARDWFRGRPPEAARPPRPVAEAFGFLRKKDAPADDADSGSLWFRVDQESGSTAAGLSADGVSDRFAAESAASSGSAPDSGPALASVSEPAPVPDSEPAPESRLQPVPAPAPDPALTDAANTAADADQSATSEAPAPADDGRVRLRALTGGLADLSDALAAIGVESVALRSAAPARPSAPAPVAATPAADFRVRCPDCGPQFVAIADVRFVETGDSAEANRYLFTCPACGARVRRPAGPELAEILKSSGVATLALRRGPGQAL